MIKQEMLILLPQLIAIHPNETVENLLKKVKGFCAENEFTL
jgi:hypothetical protein